LFPRQREKITSSPFAEKGVYADPAGTSLPTSTDPNAAESTDRVIDPTKEKPKNRVIVTIPPKVISKAVGLAIFTTLRAGFQVSGATGSGILIARLPDGSWSPPSGIQLHSVGGGFQIGLDIYDCVCVINNREALAAFTNTRVSLGSDLAVVAGPYGAGAAVEFGTSLDPKGGSRGNSRPSSSQGQDSQQALQAQQQHQQQQQNLQPDSTDKKSHRRSLSASAAKPVFSYVKSRGFYAGIRIDGTVVAERKDANAAFYGQSVSVDQILKGQVPSQGPPGMWPAGAHTLFGVLKGAEAGVLQASSHENEQRPTSPGHHQQQYPPASPSHFQQGQGQGQNHEQSYPAVAIPPSYAESGPRPYDGDIKYA
jgi:lipid-binding SYLF domain-containing protein